MKIGIFDHASLRLGGSQLLVAWMAKLLSRKAEVELIHGGRSYTLARLARAFRMDLGHVRERIVPDGLRSFSITGIRGLVHYARAGWRVDHRLTKPYDLFIYAGHGVPPFSRARRALVYCNFPFEARAEVSGRFGARWQGRSAVDRRARLMVAEWLWRRRMRGYAAVLGNSRFTCEWIQRIWGVPAEVLYPPVAVEVPAAVKQDLIVSIGRFIATDRKNHLQQLSAFRRFVSRVGPGWRLCLIGFCGEFADDRAYVARLRDAASDLPVSFLVNADRSVMLARLAEAKLFWHTSGLRDAGRCAPRHMEHFGIATVEAMAAGCVPVVAAYGGQPEIVGASLGRFTCHDEQELVEQSVRLASDPRLRAVAAGLAVTRSRAFGPDVFEERLDRLVFGRDASADAERFQLHGQGAHPRRQVGGEVQAR